MSEHGDNDDKRDKERRDSHPDNSSDHEGGEGDDFEDAADTTPISAEKSDQEDRPQSSHQEEPRMSHHDDTDSDDEEAVRPELAAHRLDSMRSLTPQVAVPQSPVEEKKERKPRIEDEPLSPHTVGTKDEVDSLNTSTDTTRPKSPLLTSHRLSTTSLAEVSLGDDHSQIEGVSVKLKGRKVLSQEADESDIRIADDSPEVPIKSPSSSSGFMGFAGKLPSVPWSPPPPPPPVSTKQLPSPPPAPARKITGPFSWLSRNSTSKEPVAPPPATTSSPGTMDRRNTQSSIATINSNPDMMLGKLEEASESDAPRRHRDSLKDRFKLLRMRDEAGIPVDETDPAIGGLARTATFNLAVKSPITEHAPMSPGPMSPNPSLFNPSLAPGTASGVAVGPSVFPESVDWDLWQSVVYEGPAAVARTSPEELNKAIATGIPSAIRGVVWQVLAQSKSEDLEIVYRNLLARGTDKDKDRMSASSGGTIGSNGSSGKEANSSASSVHSGDDHATASGATTSGMRSPSPQKDDPESVAKAHAAALADRKKKQKESAAALSRLEKAIKRDLGARTSFSKFAASAGLQDGLFGVCKAYALFDEGVGYAQGMNFLAMPLLFNMPEEEAFSLLVRLMNQYHLRDLFIQDMPGLHKHLYQFERLLEDFEPALYCHLNRRQVTPHLYATQWFLTLFAYRFPLQLVLRIYDLILSEGLEAILKFGIILMQKNVTQLLAINDMQALTVFLRDRLFDVYIDQSPSAGSILDSGFFGNSGAGIDKEVYRADIMVQDACSIKITPEMLKTYATEWEEKTKTEAAREAEMESLKNSNFNLSTKVRTLEKRVQDHDTEHAALATDLVKTKVENEELKDENESLKGQVAELRIVVEKQPAEVEERLQMEMDRLMKRNQEVHQDNAKLEDDLAEMEKNLVQTKMDFAQIKEDNESMKQRLNNMRKALD